MRKKHQEAFTLLSSSFLSSTIDKWLKMVKEWEDDRMKLNPYTEPVNSKPKLIDVVNISDVLLATTIQDIRLELAKEDANDATNGINFLHETTVTTFLTKGLELEGQQYVSILSLFL